MSTARRLLPPPWKIALAGVLASIVVSGLADPAPARAATADWAHPGYTAGDTYYNPGESVINAGSIARVTSRWSVDLPPAEWYACPAPSAPLVSGGRVFVTDKTGIGAYHPKTGAVLWHHAWPDLQDERTPHLAVSGGLLLAGNTDCQSRSDPNGGLLALDVATGLERWHVDFDPPVHSLVVDKGIAVVSGVSDSDQQEVTAFRVSDGAFRWRLLDYASVGVAANGRLLVSRVEGGVGTSAVSITTGKKLWSRAKTWTARGANPAGDRFYVTAPDGALVCVKASTGSVVWSAPGTPGKIAADGKRVYRSVPGGIEALDARTGKRRWITALGAPTGQPVRAGGLLYTTVGAGPPLGILNAATGAVASPGTAFAAVEGGNVVVAGGWLYFVNGNTLRAYAP
ncbi:MAG TPA: PQQ-binding-like beta-propeller repeat protein [Catenuloplanes sp.]